MRLRGLVALVLLPACGDAPAGEADFAAGNFAAAGCELGLSCGCFVPEESSECLTSARDVFMQDAESAREEGLSFDPSCYEAAARLFREIDCDGAVALETALEAGLVGCTPCFDYHGSALAGQACEELGVYSTCAQGLECRAEVCVDPCLVDETAVGAPCEFSDDCGDELLCDNEAARCVAPPSVGQPCLDGECAEGLRCEVDVSGMEPSSTCVLLGDIGADCTGHEECLSGYCPAGRCDPRPGLGQPCGAQEICDDDLFCDGDRCVEAGTDVCLLFGFVGDLGP